MPIPRLPETCVLCLLLVSGCAAPAANSAMPTVALSPQSTNQAQESPPMSLNESTTQTPADPDMLLGLEPRDVQAILGPVSLKRWEGDGQVMQYSNDRCVMDVYFYEATPGGAFQVTYLSARTTSGADADTALCLGSLLPN